ncbi:MAG: glycosyltransferase family 4 protein [Bacteroidales bacterium]|nr:glycosyltransferase family 4 protein [Bacteroidales bacterium]
MKILFTTDSLQGGGTERVLTILANNLIKREDYEIVIVSRIKKQDYEIDKRVKIICFDKSYEEAKKKNQRLKRYYIQYKKLKKIIKQEKPDIAVSMMQVSIYPLMFLCRGKCPVVFSEHFSMQTSINFKQDFERRFVLPFADKVTILTRHDRAYLGNRMKNKTVMYNPLSFPVMSEKEYLDSFDNRKNILACGDIDRYIHKGFDNLIHSFAKIADKYPDWQIDIAGQGSDESKNYLLSIAKQYNIDKRINFLGFRKDINDLMKQHSFYVLSSRYEGFPMVLLESMTCGCPCVAFDCVSGPSEIIVDNIDGLLIEDQDNEAFAIGMQTMIEDKEKRKMMGLRSLTNIQRFSTDIVINRWDRLFKQLYKKK